MCRMNYYSCCVLLAESLVRNAVMIIPIISVSSTHIQKRGYGNFLCMFSMGISGIKALATPCT